MSTDLKEILRRDARRREMLRDPDLTGDLLLFALALDEALATQREQRRRTLKKWIHEVAEIAHGTSSPADRYWVKRVIAADFPRYEVSYDNLRKCIAPMVRRPGPCGENATVSFLDHDPDSGVAAAVGLCTRHRRQLEPYYDRRSRQWRDNGSPTPPANVGGVLRRYFEADWETVYGWARPGTVLREGGKTATPPRPTLRLIPGGAGNRHGDTRG